MEEADRKVVNCDILVVGGGVAGISCVEELHVLSPTSSVVLLTASYYVKQVSHHRKVTRTIEEIRVEEKNISNLRQNIQGLQIVVAEMVKLDAAAHMAYTSNGFSVKYKKVNICTGGKPNIIAHDPLVLGIRDIESINYLQNKVSSAKKILVVGNGGIALEFVYGLDNCEVIWAIKDDSIGNVFLDKAAADFLLESTKNKKETLKQAGAYEDDITFSHAIKRERYDVDDCNFAPGSMAGAALGPDWKTRIDLKGAKSDSTDKSSLKIEYSCELKKIYKSTEEIESSSAVLSDDKKEDDLGCWPVYVELTNNKIYGVDLVLSATGVVPNISFQISPDSLKIAKDHGIVVDKNMRSSIGDVYAAGDICSASWDGSAQWFQMRLWTQARQMGVYSARCIIGDLEEREIMLDFCFEMFAHVTTFFGYKVCLLGAYNGQGLGNNYDILVRKTEGEEYVKAVCKDGRVFGALLIGETDLEETFENLILNQLDVSRFGESLLDPSIDIEDYFD